MSNSNQMPTVKEAYENAFAGIRQRVFFGHLAQAHGIEPRTEKQAQALLNMADNLGVVEEDETVKAAADADDPFLAADQALTNVLQQHGLRPTKQAADFDAYCNETADILAGDPTLYNSMLVLKAAEADEAYQALQQQRRSV